MAAGFTRIHCAQQVVMNILQIFDAFGGDCSVTGVVPMSGGDRHVVNKASTKHPLAGAITLPSVSALNNSSSHCICVGWLSNPNITMCSQEVWCYMGMCSPSLCSLLVMC